MADFPAIINKSETLPGILDKDILEQVREQIMAEEFSRGGEAKKEAKRLFLQKIKNEPSSVL